MSRACQRNAAPSSSTSSPENGSTSHAPSIAKPAPMASTTQASEAIAQANAAGEIEQCGALTEGA